MKNSINELSLLRLMLVFWFVVLVFSSVMFVVHKPERYINDNFDEDYIGYIYTIQEGR